MATLLKNCRIYDGTGSDAVNGSVLFEGDRIIEVGDVDESRADSVIDLEGRSLASGFIDPHSHNDWFAIKTEPLKYFEPFIRQGITTFVTGNCGLSAIGFDDDTPYKDKIGGGLFLLQRHHREIRLDKRIQRRYRQKYALQYRDARGSLLGACVCFRI